MTATNVVDMTLHRAYLEYRTEEGAVTAGRSGAQVTQTAPSTPMRGRVTRLIDITPIVLEDAQ